MDNLIIILIWIAILALIFGLGALIDEWVSMENKGRSEKRKPQARYKR